jgi:topoisomerase-4 subunit A
MATEIPAHNLREVANATVALIKDPNFSEDDVLAMIPGPDYPGGAQIISSPEEIAATYRTGPRQPARSAPNGKSKIWPVASGSWSSPNCRRASPPPR